MPQQILRAILWVKTPLFLSGFSPSYSSRSAFTSLYSISYNLPTFTTRYLFNHTFVNVKDCLFASEPNARTSCMMEMPPQTDSGQVELVPVDPLLSCHPFPAHLPSTQKTKKPGTIKRPDYRHLDNTHLCLLPSQGWAWSLPLSSLLLLSSRRECV